MNTYETLFIIHPDLEESDVNKTIDIIQELISSGGGNVLKVEKWGKRQLAYIIQKKREGYYVLIYFEASPTFIVELQRRYKLTDAIMRYLVIQLAKPQIEDILQKTSLDSESDSDADVEGDDYESDSENFEPDEQLVASTEE